MESDDGHGYAHMGEESYDMDGQHDEGQYDEDGNYIGH